MKQIDTRLSLEDICEELGLKPQFLLALADQASCMYRTFDLPKRSGGVRTISVPDDRLKGVQRLILDVILSRLEMPPHLHGCIKGRSIVTNAEPHAGKPLVIQIDLSDFFGSIKFHRIKEIFETRFGFDEKAADTFARLTTYGNFLPQGAPTSPILANIAGFDLDRAILSICTENSPTFRYDYTRYVDDLTISGDMPLARLLGEFYRAIEKCGFRANPKKLRAARASDRQKVTGIVVNERANAPKKLIRRVRQQVYYCKKFGYWNHCKKIGVDPIRFFQHKVK
ncbi:MAG: reverse transcriptase family protein [Candidatus Obscuribacterales bacterium]